MEPNAGVFSLCSGKKTQISSRSAKERSRLWAVVYGESPRLFWHCHQKVEERAADSGSLLAFVAGINYKTKRVLFHLEILHLIEHVKLTNNGSLLQN